MKELNKEVKKKELIQRIAVLEKTVVRNYILINKIMDALSPESTETKVDSKE